LGLTSANKKISKVNRTLDRARVGLSDVSTLIGSGGRMKDQEENMNDAVDTRRKRAHLSTGSDSLDEVLGGGLLTGELFEVYGESRTGKTQLALQASLIAASKGMVVSYIDTEGTFRPERIMQMSEKRGLDGYDALKRIFCLRGADSNSQIQAVEQVRTSSELLKTRLVVVDTLTKNFSLEYPGNAKTPQRQVLLAAYLDSLVRDAVLCDRAVLLTNRVTSPPLSSQSNTVRIGGETVTQYVQRSLKLSITGVDIFGRLEEGDDEGPAHTFHIEESGFV
jgi:DNA repair protein RadA